MSKYLHKVLNWFGLELRLTRNLRKAKAAERAARERRRWRVMAHRPFRTILDIGANEGQFARIARDIWPMALIHSFEPIPQVHAALAEGFAGDANFRSHNVALSDHGGTQIMHCSSFSPSSSLLPMAAVHKAEWPESAQSSDVEVALMRLDDWAGAEESLHAPLLIKIDVQGFELHVINGGQSTLAIADVVILEVSFREFYEGQPLFADVHERMRQLGFAYRGNVEQFISKDESHVLYADAIFERTHLDSIQ